MAEVAGPRVEMHMERGILFHDRPAQQQQELGTILKVDLCIWRFKQLLFVDHHGIPRGTLVTQHDIILNRCLEIPIWHAWSDHGRDLIELLRSADLPTNSYNLYDIQNRILSYANELYDPRAAMIHVKAHVTMFVTTTMRQQPREYYWDRIDETVVMDGQIVPPVLQQVPRRSERELRERYGFCASKAAAGDIDSLGDCSVCLEELVVVAGKSREQLLKMPCSHVFHGPCITKWLQLSDSCPMCRSIIPT